MKIGVFGGTFDPIHNGHLGIADVACREVGLTRVLFVPARIPWLKARCDIAAPEHRVAMIELAISSDARYCVSCVDIEREGPSYTVDTLADLSREFGSAADLYFIMGMDALVGLGEWREPERILRMCRLLVARRPGAAATYLAALERRLPGVSAKIVMVDNDLYDINSTDIRRRVAGGQSIDKLVPAAVARYIRDHGLYKEV